MSYRVRLNETASGLRAHRSGVNKCKRRRRRRRDRATSNNEEPGKRAMTSPGSLPFLFNAAAALLLELGQREEPLY
jgi:hypothetical protein